MKPLYVPAGKAREYGDLVVNPYIGCPHGCVYCYAPNVLHKPKGVFHSFVQPRKNIVEEVKKQIDKEQISGKLIHLGFVCDVYPIGYDSSVTREIIKVIKDSGNNVQILTKGGKIAERDFDLLGEKDWFGVSITGGWEENEPNAAPETERYKTIRIAKKNGINTWVSFEPVYQDWLVFSYIEYGFIDLYRIGKLNYAKSHIDWAKFGEECERLCKLHNRNYVIKDGLRAEMNKSGCAESSVLN